MQQGKRSQDVKSSFDATDDLEHVTNLSYTSHFPLNDRNAAQSTTSLHPQHSDDPSQSQAGREGEGPHRVYFDPHSQNQQNQQQHNPRSSSWDLLGGARKINEAYEHFDSRNASEQHLVFADGDLPNTKFVRFYQFLLSASIVTRWTLFIIPVLGIVWIPGIIGLTASPRGEIWGVRLIWWSIWLSVAWGGWWASLAGAMILPSIARHTIGVVAVGARRYIDWLGALRRYIALVAWTAAIWIAWNPLIGSRQDPNTSPKSKSIISFVAKFLFGIYLCAALLLFEKFSIQWIAGKFHERSYAERIAEQKFAVKTLTTLYRHSSDLHESHNHPYNEKQPLINPKRIVKQAIRGVRFAATTTTTALGNVASEIAGSSVLQPNSPQAMVQTALQSASKTKLLARRIFFSFRKPDRDHIVFQDITRFFPSQDEADSAFTLFDRDGNGDVSLDEIEQSCAEIHREQLSIEHSLSDLDSAVGRLDNLFMSLYVIVAALIIAVTLEAQLASLITATGTLVLGLSWLIGSSLHDILTSIIFLFVKHPFDVGDRIDLGDKGVFTVKEIRLLSTILLNGHGGNVQVSNNVLADLFIQNIRRSPKMSESFSFDVNYSTTFKQIERLRSLMLSFVQMERRDFQPSFDVVVLDIPDQGKMTLQADIMYKSNWQQGALKTSRRNKWICALKTYLAEAKIYGPKGDPDEIPAPVATQSFPGKKCEKRTITLVIQSYHSRCPKCPLEVTISQTEALLCVSSRRRGWLVKILKLMLNYLGIVDDTGTLFDESGTTHPREDRWKCHRVGALWHV
ncbi:Mechanosensitive ion channel-domain-containing protein [Russula aff. rugulosa BPL654]|nr:Mechanosensitive ion channel-domain-containing protein [Russula aff. rugulosa BPL654]